MGRIPVALQLFSVRGECERDLPATLRAAREIGYVGVEPWGYAGDTLDWMGHGAHELRQMLDENGLACCGIHLTTGALMGDNLARTIEMNQILGNRFLIIAWDQPRMSARDTILELAGILNSAAEALEPLGLWTGYHAHGFDFAVVDGEIAWDTLFLNTESRVVMQLDIGNCAGGGGDPIGTLRKFPDRARSVHLKDYGGPEGAVIGEGQADWPEVFRLCEGTQNTEWYVVEEGGPDGMGFDICARSFAALRSMGKC